MALPPAASTLDPAVIEMSPPVDEPLLAPTDMVMAPAASDGDIPVMKLNGPLAPVPPTGDDITSAPLETLPEPLAIVTAPPTVALDEPAAIDTSPPVAVNDLPPTSDRVAPLPLLLIPPANERSPALGASPVKRETVPEVPLPVFTVPETKATFPLFPDDEMPLLRFKLPDV